MNPNLLLCLTLVVCAGLAPQSQAASARETLLSEARTARLKAAEHPHAFRDLQIFEVASPETLAGAGFLVADGARIVAVTAKHPHEKRDPTGFVGGTNQLGLKEKIHDCDDVLAFYVDAPGVSSFRLMPARSRLLRAGDSLAVVGHDGVLSGKLTPWNLGADGVLLPGQPAGGKLQLFIPGKHDLRGNSGAPVVLQETGEVVGVLTDAVEMARETEVEFMLLSLTPPEPRVKTMPNSIFGLKPIGQPEGQVAELSGTIVPLDLFESAPGMSLTNLLQYRPYLANPPSSGLPGSDCNECLSSDYLFRSVTFSAREARVTKMELLRGVPWLTAEKVQALFEWFFASLGKPSEVFAFGEHRNRPGHVSVYCQWTNSQAVVILGVNSSRPEENYIKLLAIPSDIPRSRVLEPSWATPMPSDLGSLRRALQRLSRQPESESKNHK